MRKIAGVVVGLFVLEAACFFYAGWWVVSMFRSSGASLGQALGAGEGSWATGLGYAVAGLVYWLRPRLRLPVAGLGVLAGVYGVFEMTRSSNLLGSWNILHGDLVAVSVWSEAILVALGVVCAVELVVSRTGWGDAS
jgi:hypothetical protein